MHVRTAAAAHGAAAFVAHAGQTVAGSVLPSFAVADEDRCDKYQAKREREVEDISNHVFTVSIVGNLAKIIKMDILAFDSQVIKHFKNGLVHHGWSAEIIVNIFRSGVFTQVFIEQH